MNTLTDFLSMSFDNRARYLNAQQEYLSQKQEKLRQRQQRIDEQQGLLVRREITAYLQAVSEAVL